MQSANEERCKSDQDIINEVFTGYSRGFNVTGGSFEMIIMFMQAV